MLAGTDFTLLCVDCLGNHFRGWTTNDDQRIVVRVAAVVSALMCQRLRAACPSIDIEFRLDFKSLRERDTFSPVIVNTN